MMKKVTLIIPKHYNDGRPIEEYKIEEALNSIAAISRGYTLEECQGCFKMKDGTIKREQNWKIWIVTRKITIIVALREIVTFQLKPLFQQESMYFEVSDCDVDFL